MENDGQLDGEAVQGEVPSWGPLLALVGEDVCSEFMWMFEVRLSDGRRLDAYKHVMTRRYLHLDGRGNAYVYTGGDRYEPAELSLVLAAALDRPLCDGAPPLGPDESCPRSTGRDAP